MEGSDFPCVDFDWLRLSALLKLERVSKISMQVLVHPFTEIIILLSATELNLREYSSLQAGLYYVLNSVKTERN